MRHHCKKILSLQKYFITKKQKQKKLKLHWLKYSFQQLYFFSTLIATPLRVKVTIVCTQVVPIKTPSFEPNYVHCVVD